MDLLISQTTTLAPPSLLRASVPTYKNKGITCEIPKSGTTYSILQNIHTLFMNLKAISPVPPATSSSFVFGPGSICKYIILCQSKEEAHNIWQKQEIFIAVLRRCHFTWLYSNSKYSLASLPQCTGYLFDN